MTAIEEPPTKRGITATSPTAALPAVPVSGDAKEAWVWEQIRLEARRDAEAEPSLASYLYSTILCHPSLERALSFHLGNRLCSATLLSTLLYNLFHDSLASSPSLRSAAVADVLAARLRDPACSSFSHCLLNYKGFLALQAHRVSHSLWLQGRSALALALHSRVLRRLLRRHPPWRSPWIRHPPRPRHRRRHRGDSRRWRQRLNPSPCHARRNRQDGRRPPPKSWRRCPHWCRGHRAWKREYRRGSEDWRRLRGANRRSTKDHSRRQSGEARRRTGTSGEEQ